MKMSNIMGILFVDSKRMRSQLHESTVAIVAEIKAVLLTCARANAAVVLEDAKQWCKQLEPRPEELEGYVEIKDLWIKMEREKEELNRWVGGRIQTLKP